MNSTLRALLRPVVVPALWVHHRLLPRDKPGVVLAYLWLCFLPFFFINYTPQPFPAYWWLYASAGAIVFLVLYFRMYREIQQELPWLLGGIALLGYVFFVVPPHNGYTFIIYASAFCGFLVGSRKGLVALFTIVSLFAIEGFVLHWLFEVPYIAWTFGVFLGLIIGIANIYFGELGHKNKALKQSQEEIRRLATTAERERIARDLHDLLGHTLTLITIKAELAAKFAERDLAGAAREIREVERISRDALAQVREVVGGYRSGGLTGELSNVRVALTAVDVKLAEKVDPPKLSPLQDSVLAMVLREAVTNVIRHSGAQHCRIELENQDWQLRLLIEDDGRGGRVQEGNGLKGIRERLREVSGHLEIDSSHSGTRLTVLLPLGTSGQASGPVMA
ncbi:MAG TPA: sensor histidine kinase [Gammaproteobacteria bacterium]|nr:sensor histidine kinase [Gammaproteobacteria bacterium]